MSRFLSGLCVFFFFYILLGVSKLFNNFESQNTTTTTKTIQIDYDKRFKLEIFLKRFLKEIVLYFAKCHVTRRILVYFFLSKSYKQTRDLNHTKSKDLQGLKDFSNSLKINFTKQQHTKNNKLF